MSSVDERVVDMKFNKDQFVKGVSDTTKSLDDLKKGLQLDGATKGLTNLDNAGKKFSLQNISDGVQALGAKFSALGIVAITALQNITNRAIDAGMSLAKSLTVEPILAGFQEYELKMGSIQTILANTARHGTGLPEVTKNLDELNTYADKTIYNFGAMTKNIGLFTNAGIKIEDATSMIKGFSNEAATSGTSAEGAAGAAYQLSQALSAGTIRLMDWRSLQNVGMGNKNMQNGLIEIAEAMGAFEGTTIDAQTASDDFNGSLEKNWLSAEVMTNYLKIQAGDLSKAQMQSLGLTDDQITAFRKQQKTAEEAATKVRTWTQLIETLKEGVGSTWAQTFDMLIGDFNEATELWTNVNNTLGDIIGSAGDARNKIVKDWVAEGGREAAIETLGNMFKALMSIIEPIQEAMSDIFPPITGKQAAALTEVLRSFSETLILSKENSENLKRTFRGLFALLDIGWMILKEGVKMFVELFGGATKGASGILDFAGGIGDFIVCLRDAIKNGEGLSKFFSGLGKVLSVPVNIIRGIVGVIGLALDALANIDTTGFEGFIEKVGAQFKPLAGIADFVAAAWKKLGEVFAPIIKFFAPLGDMIGGALSEMGTAVSDAVTNMDFDGLLALVNTGLFGALVLSVKKFFGGFAKAIPKDGGGLIDTIKGIFGGLTDTLDEMQTTLKAGTLILIAGALALLTASIVALSLIDPAALAKALGALTVMFMQLMVAMNVFGKIAMGAQVVKLTILAGAMILIGIAINILAMAVAKLARLSWVELAKGLSGVIVLLGSLAATAKLMGKDIGGIMAASLAMIAVGIAVNILADAVIKLSSLSWEELSKGLVGVGAVLAGLALFTKMASVNKGAMTQAVGLILLATAIQMLANATGVFASMDTGGMVQGLLAIGGILAMFAIFSKLTGDGSGLIKTALSMVIIGAAMNILVGVISALGAMSWEEIAKGLVGLAGALLVIVGAMYLMPPNMLLTAASLVIVGAALQVIAAAMMSFGGMSWEEIGKSMVMLAGSLLILAGAMYLMTGAIVGAAAILIVSAALSMLAPALATLGSMSWDEIGRGLAVLAGAFLIIGLAGLLLTPVIPTLLGLGIAVALLGAGMMLAGVGILAFALGLTALGVAGAAGTAGLVAVVSGLIGLIPMMLTKFGEGLVALAGVIATGAPAFIAAFAAVLTSLAAGVVEAMPAIIEAIVVLLQALLQAIRDVVPDLLETVTVVIQAALDAIVTLVPAFVDAGLKILKGVMKGIADNIGGIVDEAVNVVTNFINAIGDNIPKVIQSGVDLILDFINGVADAIRNNSAALNDAGANLADAIVDGLVNGLTSAVSWVADAAAKLADAIPAPIKKALGIASPSKVAFALMEWFGIGMSDGLLSKVKTVEASSAKIGDSAMGGLKKSLMGLSKLVDSDLDASPTIRPVLDLSGIKKDSSLIGGMLSQDWIPIEGLQAKAADISGMRRSQEILAAQESEELVSAGDTNVTYIQNNQSPKALSRAEIYRQTKNQLSAAKGTLKIHAEQSSD